MTSRTEVSDHLHLMSQSMVKIATAGRELTRPEVAQLAGVLRRLSIEALQLEVAIVAHECAAGVAAEAGGPLPRAYLGVTALDLPMVLETLCRSLQGAARRGEILEPHHTAALALLARSCMGKAELLVDAARERDKLRAIAADLDVPSPPRPRSRPIPIEERGPNVYLLPVVARPVPPAPAPGPGDAA